MRPEHKSVVLPVACSCPEWVHSRHSCCCCYEAELEPWPSKLFVASDTGILVRLSSSLAVRVITAVGRLLYLHTTNGE